MKRLKHMADAFTNSGFVVFCVALFAFPIVLLFAK